ncbi:MAG TPA: aminotransferase class IV [Bacteroidales bacterium]|nr:aminotransferase class IV [Bacteroidales bacterium]HPF04156.1 aminotransferase class IV [Bacteroidales bacterium]HPJ59643.1 aminotransferase class IV [Bacteroidales bacterium]HPR10956.1 aminotransferase class IV [Bacteroidales bacterium]HRW85827.1 aminotransferase class IV [Bacteroidales bacterium]
MNECYGKKFILNGDLIPEYQFDNSLVYSGQSVYEVIRMVKGSPVFFHDHMERLAISTRLIRKKMITDEETLRRDIIRLSKTERRKEVNLKIVFNYNRDSLNYLVYFIEPIYPDDEQYRNGVKGILYYAERDDPSSKVINHMLRSSIWQKLILEGAYEALLVNSEGQVTEGSRSNIFFLKGKELTTAPGEIILNGITRKHILEICRENGITVFQECVAADKIAGYDAVFMTGTSPVVLPFCCIDDITFRVDFPIIRQLRNLYIRRAEESIDLFRNIKGKR